MAPRSPAATADPDLALLEPEKLVEAYRLMVLARALDERMWILQRQGKVPFVITGQGQEAAQVGAALALRAGHDIVLPYYRDIALVLALGMSPRELMLSAFARAADPNSGGRQMPNHFSSRKLRILTGSSPVGTQIPHAAGAALASRLRGEDSVVLVSFGEGASSEGDFHEGVNFAAIHRLPVVFFCENNGWAISVPSRRQMSVEGVARRAAGYGIAGVAVDGQDLLAVYRAVAEAAERGRRGEGPTIVEALTYRFVPHSSDDDDRIYRSADEMAEMRRRDPIPAFRERLEAAGLWDGAREERLRQEVAATVDDAADHAERSPQPDPATVMRHVFASSGKDGQPWRSSA
ncbi:MAG: thiamine pyrophosphate-dependent dehydrogenase E1 component subunit alpha [Limnochordaceae bacterium]|nr:thiamine pyrophosphate-dependent dehydrogenase E1 component subunit alpha [Limnochordaceae bacterium]